MPILARATRHAPGPAVQLEQAGAEARRRQQSPARRLEGRKVRRAGLISLARPTPATRLHLVQSETELRLLLPEIVRPLAKGQRLFQRRCQLIPGNQLLKSTPVLPVRPVRLPAVRRRPRRKGHRLERELLLLLLLPLLTLLDHTGAITVAPPLPPVHRHPPKRHAPRRPPIPRRHSRRPAPAPTPAPAPALVFFQRRHRPQRRPQRRTRRSRRAKH